jgi:hypothetical protein
MEPTEISVNSVNALLQQVSIIQKKYDDIAELTGEKFNVFQLLNVNHYENTHSSILSYFLNSKGNHGQKDLFLKLFLEVLNEKFLCFANDKNAKILPEDSHYYEINKFQTEDSESITEYLAGKIDEDYLNGGRIDILLRDKFKQQIIIENKIYAVDQENQLVRYKNFDKRAPIFYLNLWGDEPSINSKGELIGNKDYFIISYETDIIRWLEKCIKECFNKPFIRETLNQYLNLIKELTNQSTNKNMEKEIATILMNNFSSFIQILENQNAVFDEINIKMKKMMTDLASKLNISLANNYNFSAAQYSKFEFRSSKLDNLNLVICFNFEEKNYNDFCFGINYTVGSTKERIDLTAKLKFAFENKFGRTVGESDYSPAWAYYDEFRNWGANNYEILNSIIMDDFKTISKDIEEKVIKMLEIVDEL